MASEETKILEVKVETSEAVKKIAEYKLKIDGLKEAEKQYKEEVENGTMSQKKYHEEMTKSKIESKSYKEAINILEKQVKSQVKAQNDNSKIMKEVNVLLEANIGSIAEAEAANKALREAVRNLTLTNNEAYDMRNKLNAKIEQNTAFIKRNTDSYVQQKMTIGDYKEQIKLAIFEIKNGEKGFKNLGIVAKGFGNILRTSVRDSVKEVASGVTTMIKGFVGAQAVIGLFQNLVGLLKDGINTAIKFEEANSKLAAILGVTAKETKELQAQARELGATTQYTADQATNLQIELAKLGFTMREIQDSTKYILLFAQATGSDLAEAASLAGASLRMFDADTVETERYVSAMAVATTKSALSFSYLATALPIVGPVAKSFNFTIEDTLSLLGKLADSGFDASSAATATRNIFLNLADVNGKLAKSLGKPISSLDELAEGLIALREKGIDLNKALELTDKRSVAAFNSFLTAADKIKPLRDSVTDVGEGLAKMADEMSNNTAGAIKTLSSAWDELMISINGNTTAIRTFVETLTNGVKWITSFVKSTEQLTEEQIRNAKLMGESSVDEKVVKKNIEAIERVRDAYIKSGIDENEALEKAKQERIEILERNLKQEEELADKFYQKNQEARKAYEDASFLKQGLGLEKSDAELIEEINDYWDKYTKQLSYIAALKKQIDIVQKQSNDEKDKTKNKPIIITHEQLEKEKEAIRQLEDSLLSLIDNNSEKQREQIAKSYDVEIALLKKRLSTEKGLTEEAQNEILSIIKGKEKQKQEAIAKVSIVDADLEAERQRTILTYDREIEDLKKRLQTEQDLTAKAREAINETIKAKEKQKETELDKLNDEAISREVERQQKLIQLQLEGVKEGTRQEHELRMQQLQSQREAELQDKTLTEQMKLAIVQKYEKLMSDETARYANETSQKQMDAIKVRFETAMEQAYGNEKEILRIQMEQRKAELDAIQQMEGESLEEFNLRRLQAENDYLDAKKDLRDKEVEIEQSKLQAMSDITGGLISLMEAIGEENKAMAVASKVLALAEIAINTGKAIAAGVAEAVKIGFPQNIAAIATTVATVLANIATAIKTVKSAKFATGGDVVGAGTGTSDSIPAMLSNGESVLTAKATSMFAPILSAMNQAGGGVPINGQKTGNQAMGEDMLARAFAKGVAGLPNPVVSVVDINNTAKRVEVIENINVI